MNALVILKGIEALLALVGMLQKLGVNFREVIDMQEKASAEGRELSDAELQILVEQAQDAVDRL